MEKWIKNHFYTVLLIIGITVVIELGLNAWRMPQHFRMHIVPKIDRLLLWHDNLEMRVDLLMEIEKRRQLKECDDCKFDEHVSDGRPSCYDWAFGKPSQGIYYAEIDARWNDLHGDLFIIESFDNLQNSLKRIESECLKRGFSI